MMGSSAPGPASPTERETNVGDDTARVNRSISDQDVDPAGSCDQAGLGHRRNA